MKAIKNPFTWKIAVEILSLLVINQVGMTTLPVQGFILGIIVLQIATYDYD